MDSTSLNGLKPLVWNVKPWNLKLGNPNKVNLKLHSPSCKKACKSSGMICVLYL